MLDRLRNNLTLKLLSLAIAVVAWAYLRLTPNPVIAARFVQQVSVPIATTGLPADEIARFSDKEAVVAVAVPRGGASIKPDMVRAVLDLEGRKPGVYNVPLQVIAPVLEIKSLSPASITLVIERVDRRSVPVVIHYVGDLRRNVVVQHVDVLPAAATLRAPTSDLAKVQSVRVDVPFPSGPSTVDAMLRPVASDARGAEIAAVDVAPNLMRVRARFVAAQKAK